VSALLVERMNERQQTVHPRPWLRASCAAAFAPSTSAVRWAVARKGRGIVAGGAIAREDGGSDDDAALLRSAAACAQAHRPGLFVVVVPGTQVPVRPVRPSLRDVKRLQSTLDHVLEPLLPFELAEVTTDHVITVRGSAVEDDVLSIACPRSVSEPLVAAVRSAQAPASLLDHEGVALFNLARRTWAASGTWCLFSLAEDSFGWVFGQGDRLVLCRFLRVADPGLAFREWERSVRTVPAAAEWTAAENNCRIVGSDQAMEPWQTLLRAKLGFAPPPLSSNRDLMVAGPAAGAALRGCGTGLAIDLLPTPVRQRPAVRPMIRAAWTAAALLAVISLVPIVGGGVRSAVDAARLRHIDQDLLAVCRTAGIPSPPPQQELYALDRRAEQLARDLTPCISLMAEPAASRLSDLLQAAPQGTQFERVQMTPTSTVARARLSVPGSAPAFRTALTRPGRAVETRMLPANDEISRVEITLREKGLRP
jgi:hypothetical protein